MRPIIKLLRPHHWLKNFFVFVAPFFSGAWLNAQLDLHVALAFVAFCAAASCVYVVNDLIDAPADRMHPKKKHRPIASRAVSERTATILAIVLFVAASAFSWAASGLAMALTLTYLALNAYYCFKGKDEPVVDVFCIALGFGLRMLAGGPALGIPLDPLIWCSGFFFTVMLGFGKRRVELAQMGERAAITRKSLAACSLPLLDTLCALFAGLSLVCYVSWSLIGHNLYLMASCVPASLCLARHFFMMHSKGHGEDLAREVFVDKPLLGSAAFWALLVGLTQLMANPLILMWIPAAMRP